MINPPLVLGCEDDEFPDLCAGEDVEPDFDFEVDGFTLEEDGL